MDKSLMLTSPQAITLLKPHTHGRYQYQKGDVLTVESNEAQWLAERGVAENYDGKDSKEISRNQFYVQGEKQTQGGATDESIAQVADAPETEVIDGTGEDGENAPIDTDKATRVQARRTRS